MNQEILDEDLDRVNPDLQRESRNRKATLYLSIMIIGCISTAVLKYHDLRMIVYQSVIIFIIPAFFALISESIRYLIRKSKGHRHKDPFWFHLIEGALSFWILLTILLIVEGFLDQA